MIDESRYVLAAALALGGCGGGSGGTETSSTSEPTVGTSGGETESSGTPTNTSAPPSSSSSGTGGTTAADDTTQSDTGTGDADTTGGVQPGGEFEGYGALTEGAHSCDREPDVVRVTSLADGGPGSLRDALSQGCREIVFDVGGTITLEGDLNIPYSFITIDGTSAPAPGITIEQPGTIGTTIEASGSVGPVSDIIIHHLRMDGMAIDHANDGDIWGLDGEAASVSNIILDHITATGATDGVFDIWEEVHDVTISWNLITDTVTALHLSTGDETTSRDRISFHHNVFAGNNERQIRIRHDNGDIDYRNNVIYGWGWFEGGAAGLHIAYDQGETNPSLNVVGNVFHFVDGLAGSADDAIKFERGSDEGTVYFAGNLVPARESDNLSSGSELPVPAQFQVTEYDPSTLADVVVPNVGTHFPTDAESTRLAEIASAL